MNGLNSEEKSKTLANQVKYVMTLTRRESHNATLIVSKVIKSEQSYQCLQVILVETHIRSTYQLDI